MRIDSLRVENFRCFVKEEWEFAPGFNVFIGDNGAGKTAILSALAVATGSLFLGIDGIASRIIQVNDAHCTIFSEGDNLFVEDFYPVSVESELNIYESGILIKREKKKRNGTTTYYGARNIKNVMLYVFNVLKIQSQFELIDNLVSVRGDEFRKESLSVKEKARSELKSAGIDADLVVYLPLAAAYSAGRAWLKLNKKSQKLIRPIPRMRGYENCLDAASDDAFLYDWFRTRELAALQKGGVSETMQGVRAAVVACLGEEWEQIWYEIDLGEIMAKRKDGTQLPVRLLSDGQRSILAMGLDMAYRAAVLNPQLGGRAAQETPGVVLIDELDLHLHPNWQRTIVPNLRRAFPKVQFFVTTHSPIILQGLDPKLDRVIRLNAPGPSTYPPVEDFIDKPLEDILMDVQDYPAFKLSERRQKMIAAAEKYYTVLKQAEKASDAELERLKQEMDTLALPFHDDYAYVAFLNMERQAALGERN
ncbi:AAA family ATPase [Armatimonas sp.]|uniref:AAA family ATPase n=1 Tax=Armatimonas sp. TaxID=1872638 RepID=UPI00286D37AC|nr:AAA family ATPase [Armatimonas sp.]